MDFKKKSEITDCSAFTICTKLITLDFYEFGFGRILGFPICRFNQYFPEKLGETLATSIIIKKESARNTTDDKSVRATPFLNP